MISSMQTNLETKEPVAKASLHPMKVLPSVWWNRRGIIHFELLPASETINEMNYYNRLPNLSAVIQEKQSEFDKSKKYHFLLRQRSNACYKTDLAED